MENIEPEALQPKRPGGRKPLPENKKKQQHWIYLTPPQVKKLDKLALRDKLSRSELLIKHFDL